MWATAVLAAILTLGGGLPADAAPPPREAHPDLVSGTLANGLDYLILPRPGQTGVSFRLLVWVGSQAETPQSRGIAHLVEHMAFRSTRHFADGEVEAAMAEAGAALGQDHNAYTSRWTTTYHLDLPTADPAAITRGLTWLRDVGDGMLFRPEELAAERGVVLAERLDRQRSGDANDDLETAFHFSPEDTLSPGGEAATLSVLTPEDLKAFHARWYRPDRSELVVTGDVAPDDIILQLETHLGGWAGAGARPHMADTLAPDPPAAAAALILAPARLPPQSMVCRNTAAPVEGQDPLAGPLDEDVLHEILNRRLARAAAHTRGVYQLQFAAAGQYETRQVSCVRAVHAPGAGPDAMGLAQATLRTFAALGPAQAEIDAAVASERAKARGALTELASATPGEIADELLYATIHGRPFLHPHQTMRQISQGAPQLSPEGLTGAFRALWPAASPPTLSLEDGAVSAEAVLARWQEGEAAPLAEPLPPPTPLAHDFGRPGRVVRREDLGGGVAALTFANGLALKHRASDLAPGWVEIVIRMGPGARSLRQPDGVAAGIAAQILPLAGLKTHTYGALQELFPDWDWAFEADLNEDGLFIRNQSFAVHVTPQLAMITAHLAAPGFNAEMADSLALAAAHLEQENRLNPVSAVDFAVSRAIWPDTDGAALDPDTYRRLTPEALRAALRPHLETGPIELILVGDITEAQAIEAAARTLGARPPRPPSRPGPAQAPTDPAPAPPDPIEVAHEGPAERSAARLYWTHPPMVGPEAQAAALALSGLLEAAVIDETRRRRGRTYSPSVELSNPLDGPDHVSLHVEFTPDARSLDEVTEVVLQTASRLVAAPPRPEALEQIRRPLLAELEAMERSDAVWALLLARPEPWETTRTELDNLRRAVTALTPGDLHDLARAWLSSPPLIVLARPAAAPIGDAP